MYPTCSNYLVVDPIFGDGIRRLPHIEVAWVADTAVNGPPVRWLWRERGGSAGIQVFAPSETESEEECALRIVGEIGDSLPLALRVIGASLSSRLRSRFAEFGFVRFQKKDDGFVAYK